MIQNRERLVEDYALRLETLTGTEDLDRRAAALREKYAVVAELLRKAVEHNVSAALHQEADQSRYTSLAARYEAAKTRLDQIEDEKIERSSRKERTTPFLAEIEQREERLTAFDEALWCATVETVTIYHGREAVFRHRDGGEAKRGLDGTR